MAIVSGKVRVNRPYFFTDVNGDRAEFPAFGEGAGELEGASLREFNMYVTARQIEGLPVNSPSNINPPTITGTAQVGETLTATTGTWDGDPAPTFTYQWSADGAEIDGATGTTYDPIEDDVGKEITVSVTGTNIVESDTATSEPTDPVLAAE